MSNEYIHTRSDHALLTQPLTLSHVNVPPAQTWNYLHVNDVCFDVPATDAQGKVYEAVPRLFDTIETGVGEQAASWIVAAAGDGRYVEVPRDTIREEPIAVTLDQGQIANTAILVREGAQATVVVVASSHRRPDDAAVPSAAPSCVADDPAPVDPASPVSAALTRIIAERGARVSLIELVAFPEDAKHLEGVGIRAGKDVQIDVRQYALGGAKVAFGFSCELAGEHSKLDLTMRYHVGGTTLLDVNHVCRQRGRASRAEMHTSGVLADAAQKTARETIDLVHGAKGARGNESETVVVTGHDVVNKTLPVILCDEEDVAGNHGATIGSISCEQLDYLADRGLNTEQAKALFVRAVFDDAIINAPTPNARTAALNRASQVLGASVARDLTEALPNLSEHNQEA